MISSTKSRKMNPYNMLKIITFLQIVEPANTTDKFSKKQETLEFSLIIMSFFICIQLINKKLFDPHAYLKSLRQFLP